MTIIVAFDENNAIGNNNQLLWHLPEDLKRFKKLTSGHAIIMGRKTFESLKKPLPNRKNIVISRNKQITYPEGVIVVQSLEEAFETAKQFDDSPFIIGGGEIYRQSLEFADKLEITQVHTKIADVDTFFPEIDSTKWRKIHEEFHQKDEKHPFDYTFIRFEKK